MHFDPTSMPHRHLLAAAIQHYIDDKRIPLTYHNQPVDSLLHRLETAKLPGYDKGIGINRSALNKLVSVDQKALSAPASSAGVIAFLTKESYWPISLHHALALLPGMFDGIKPENLRRLSRVTGTYVSYQYSSRDPDHIVIGKTTISEPTDWGYSHFRNYIDKTTSRNKIDYCGIAWADHSAIHVLLRAEGVEAGFPHFLLFDTTDSEYLFGTGLGNARTAIRHLTSIVLHKTDYPENDTPIPPALRQDRLTWDVASHLLCVLKHGPVNYPTEFAYTSPASTPTTPSLPDPEKATTGSLPDKPK